MSPQNSGSENSPDNNAGDKGTENGEQKIESASNDWGLKPKRIFDGLFTALELFALIFWILSEKFHSGHWIIHSLLLSVAVCFFAAGGTHALNNWLQKPLICSSIGGSFALIATVVVFVRSHEDSKPLIIDRPHFALSLETVGIPKSKILLTNDFLKIGLKKMAPLGRVLFVLPNSATNLNLMLSLDNASKTKANEVAVQLMFPADMGFSNQGWMQATTPVTWGLPNGEITNAMQSWVIRSPCNLLPFEGLSFPNFGFRIPAGVPIGNVPFGILVHGDDGVAAEAIFLISIMRATENSSPDILSRPLLINSKPGSVREGNESEVGRSLWAFMQTNQVFSSSPSGGKVSSYPVLVPK